jgi:long-chain acyl-CoA synthetase
MSTIIDLFETSVQKFGDNPFLWEKQNGKYKSLTFKEVADTAKAFGAGLISMNIQKNDRIVILAEGCSAWVMAELGVFYAGGISVPVTVKLNEPHDLIFRINHSESKVIIATASQAQKLENCSSQLGNIQAVIFLDTLVPISYSLCDTFENVVNKGKQFLIDHNIIFDERIKALQPSDYASICYTSGTTSDPKGIILTHRNYTANTEQALNLIDVPSYYSNLLILPWDHSFAHTAGIYTVAKAGASLAAVQLGKSSLETLKNIPSNIKEIKPYFLLSVPSLAKNFYKNIVSAIASEGKAVELLFNFALKISYAYNYDGFHRGRGFRILLSPLVKLFDGLFYKKIRENFGGNLKFFVGGGALLDMELQRFFYAIGIPMLQGYGLTEASPIISANSLKCHKLGTSGKVVFPLQIKICDDKGEQLPTGTPGEIVIKGENVMAGYWKNEASTRNTIKDGWLYTGDMGYLDSDGFLYVLGRFKSLLVGNDGEKYWPEVIEEAIVSHCHFIDQCMLYNNQNPYTTALIVPNREAIRHWIKEHHSHHHHEVVDELLRLMEKEINEFKGDGKFAFMFPQRWLPAAISIIDEPFSEENELINSSMKLVRYKVVEAYRDRIDELFKPDGKNICHLNNQLALKRLIDNML